MIKSVLNNYIRMQMLMLDLTIIRQILLFQKFRKY